MCQYFNEEKKKRKRKKCTSLLLHTLSRARREHIIFTTTFFFSSKSHFFDGRKEPLFIFLSLSLCFEGKNRAKKISKRRIFSLFSSTTRKDKKKQRGEHPKKRKTKFFQHRLHGPKFSLSMMMRANKNAPPPFNKQRERRVDFKLAQKQPNVFYCYDASGRARVWTRCGSDRARFPDARERANFSLRNFFSFSFCFWARKSFFRSQNSG